MQSRCRALRTKLKQAPSGIAERLRISSLQSVKAPKRACADHWGGQAPSLRARDGDARFRFSWLCPPAHRMPQSQLASATGLPRSTKNATCFFGQRSGLAPGWVVRDRHEQLLRIEVPAVPPPLGITPRAGRTALIRNSLEFCGWGSTIEPFDRSA
jgi:hypothetical protein